MNNKAAKVFIIVIIFLIGFSLLPLAVNAFSEKLDWDTYAMAYQFNCAYVDQIPTEECEALVDFYNNTAGEHWKDNSGWLVSDRPDDWYGVSVVDGHVKGLNLAYNFLFDDVPNSLVNLTYLEELDLDYNKLYIPDGYPLEGNPLHQFLYSRDADWHLKQGIYQVIFDTHGGTFSSLDGSITLTIDPHSMYYNGSVSLQPIPKPEHPYSGLIFAQNSFQMKIHTDYGWYDGFIKPVDFTIKYDPAALNLPEDTLRLYLFDESSGAWVDAATKCNPPQEYERNLEENNFTVQVCRVGEFAVFSDAMRYFLPGILR